MAVTTARQTSLVGADVRLLVLAAGRQWCAAIDLGSGALVSAEWRAPAPAALPRLSIVGARLAGDGVDEGEGDPMRPEAMTLAGPPQPIGRMARRRARRWLRPLLHPAAEHILGFAGPAVPYWTLTGERASVAVVAPPTPPVVAGGECRFEWRNTTHVLPVLPAALAACPPRPRQLLVALSPPRAGHCYKVVAGLL
ncbi:MAG: hypothetical protein M3P85_05270 [Actinomycetota bacterium]|nr:hypothetical protein [Actinomycetota bacterium]